MLKNGSRGAGSLFALSIILFITSLYAHKASPTT